MEMGAELEGEWVGMKWKWQGKPFSPALSLYSSEAYTSEL